MKKNMETIMVHLGQFNMSKNGIWLTCVSFERSRIGDETPNDHRIAVDRNEYNRPVIDQVSIRTMNEIDHEKGVSILKIME